MNTKLGVFYTCFTEKAAVQYSLEKLFEIYPEIPVYLVSDGGSDYSFLYDIFPGKKIKCCLEDDTRGIIGVIDRSGDYYSEKNRETMLKSVNVFLKRVDDAIKFCDSEYLLVMEPDVLVRGKITIPEGADLLGSRVNRGISSKLKKYMRSYEGAIVVDTWGVTPGIFSREGFDKILELLHEDKNLLETIYSLEHRLPYYDVLFAILFGFVGISETFNPEITECFRDESWKTNNRPLLHQFRKYYPSKEEHNSIYATANHDKLTKYFE